MEKFAVLGCGNGGKAVAAELAFNGASVSIYEAIPNDGFRKLQETKELKLTGAMELSSKMDLVTDDLEEAIKGRKFIMVVVPSFAHEDIFRNLLPLLEDKQNIIVVPGNYSTFLFKTLIDEMKLSPEVTISETVSLPYACRATDFDTVEIYKKKNYLKMGTYPQTKSEFIITKLNEVLPMFRPAKNVLEVALDNPNFVVHPLPTLLNIASIENNPSGWRHYIDGISPVISSAIHELDKERIEIGKAFGLNLMTTIEALKEYYGNNDSETIYEYVNSDESPYKDIYGQNVFGRYVSEDLPYLAVPAKALANIAGIDTPWIDTVIQLGSMIHHKDYKQLGYNSSKIGIEGMTVEEIKNLIE